MDFGSGGVMDNLEVSLRLFATIERKVMTSLI